MANEPSDVISDWQMQEALEQSFGDFTPEMETARDQAVRWIDGWTEVGLLPITVRRQPHVVIDGKPLTAKLPQGARATRVRIVDGEKVSKPRETKQENRRLRVYSDNPTWSEGVTVECVLNMGRHQIPGALRAACMVLAKETYANLGGQFKPNTWIESMIEPFLVPGIKLSEITLNADFTRERA